MSRPPTPGQRIRQLERDGELTALALRNANEEMDEAYAVLARLADGEPLTEEDRQVIATARECAGKGVRDGE